MARPKRPYDDDALRKASDQLHYEMVMMVDAAQTALSWHKDEGFESNAVVETFCIHARALVDFLYTRVSGAKDYEVVAGNYFRPSDRWDNIVGKKPPWLGRIYGAISNEIAHITTRRHPFLQAKTQWPYRKIVPHVMNKLALFVEHVERAKIAADVWPGRFLADTGEMRSLSLSGRPQPGTSTKSHVEVHSYVPVRTTDLVYPSAIISVKDPEHEDAGH